MGVSYTPLMTKIVANKNNVFLRSSSWLILKMLNAPSSDVVDASIFHRMMFTRVLLEMEGIKEAPALLSLREAFCKCALYLLSLNYLERSEIVGYVGSWVEDGAGWAPSLKQALKAMVCFVVYDWCTLMTLFLD